MSEMYDVVIIGGGPAGLAAAIYAGRAQRKTLLIEKGSYGGRINDTREIRNYPGTISDSGAGLMENSRNMHAAMQQMNSSVQRLPALKSNGWKLCDPYQTPWRFLSTVRVIRYRYKTKNLRYSW